MLQAAIDEAQRDVTGTVGQALQGNCLVVGRKSTHSLYRNDFVTFEADQVYHQHDAEGFIRLNGLRLKIRSTRPSLQRLRSTVGTHTAHRQGAGLHTSSEIMPIDEDRAGNKDRRICSREHPNSSAKANRAAPHRPEVEGQ